MGDKGLSKSKHLYQGLLLFGSIYRHLGEYYGVFQDIDEAKVYTSKKRAVNAMEKLKVKVWNWDSMEVELLEDEE